METYEELIEMKALPMRSFVSDYKRLQVRPHWHNEIEILHVLEGTAISQLDNNVFPIEKGDVVIIWSNQFHSFYEGNNTKIIVLQFNVFDYLTYTKKWRNLKFSDKISPDCSAGIRIKTLTDDTNSI